MRLPVSPADVARQLDRLVSATPAVVDRVIPSRNLIRGDRRARLRRAVEGQVVVVTGASSGIGEAIAVRLGQCGAEVALVARTAEKLDAVAERIRADGGAAKGFAADLSDGEEADRVAREILAEHGRVDVLVNNAGLSIRRSVANSYDRVHDFERTMQLNYFGALRLTLAFLPGMRERGDGHIVNVSTMGMQVNPPRFAAYSASKAAFDAFSRSLAAEVIGDGVHVTTVFMPLVRTPMIQPTRSYRNAPALSPAAAAWMALDAMSDRPRIVSTTTGRISGASYSVAPKLWDRGMNLVYRATGYRGGGGDQ